MVGLVHDVAVLGPAPLGSGDQPGAQGAAGQGRDEVFGESGGASGRLDDEVDRLRAERGRAEVAPAVDRDEQGGVSVEPDAGEVHPLLDRADRTQVPACVVEGDDLGLRLSLLVGLAAALVDPQALGGEFDLVGVDGGELAAAVGEGLAEQDHRAVAGGGQGEPAVRVADGGGGDHQGEQWPVERLLLLRGLAAGAGQALLDAADGVVSGGAVVPVLGVVVGDAGQTSVEGAHRELVGVGAEVEGDGRGLGGQRPQPVAGAPGGEVVPVVRVGVAGGLGGGRVVQLLHHRGGRAQFGEPGRVQAGGREEGVQVEPGRQQAAGRFRVPQQLADEHLARLAGRVLDRRGVGHALLLSPLYRGQFGRAAGWSPCSRSQSRPEARASS